MSRDFLLDFSDFVGYVAELFDLQLTVRFRFQSYEPRIHSLIAAWLVVEIVMAEIRLAAVIQFVRCELGIQICALSTIRFAS